MDGAGILPIAYLDKELYFLFGLEREFGTWSDFGGGKYKHENNIDTASREGSEELNGFFGSSDDIKKLINNNTLVTISSDKYITYVVLINFDKNLPYYFNNNYKCIKLHEPQLLKKEGLYEKSMIKWFSKTDIVKEKDTFREFYREEFLPQIFKYFNI